MEALDMKYSMRVRSHPAPELPGVCVCPSVRERNAECESVALYSRSMSLGSPRDLQVLLCSWSQLEEDSALLSLSVTRPLQLGKVACYAPPQLSPARTNATYCLSRSFYFNMKGSS
ncbi:hypothetical protein E2C01_032652 [Portunus trituberculatus]|uniref:Uncharacterized protein n=1 Tax=Portunus trituberculatus TaxID=210409 RepID=A0A5B7EWI4_PORTR|nr:hypothetical protein [Portunus trituberculatus]